MGVYHCNIESKGKNKSPYAQQEYRSVVQCLQCGETEKVS